MCIWYGLTIWPYSLSYLFISISVDKIILTPVISINDAAIVVVTAITVRLSILYVCVRGVKEKLHYTHSSVLLIIIMSRCRVWSKNPGLALKIVVPIFSLVSCRPNACLI